MNGVVIMNVMVILAVATPVAGGILLYVIRRNARLCGEPLGPSMRRNLIILVVAGPANLGLWYLLNVLLDAQGADSILGYVAAVVVFVVAGFATGFFPRVFSGFGKRPDHSGPH